MIKSVGDRISSLGPVWMVYLLFSAVIFYLSYITAWSWDDIFYQFDLLTGQRIGSFSDIWESQVYHYKINNGRFLAHTLVQMVLCTDHLVFALFNTLANVAFVMLIIKIAGASYRSFASTLSVALLVLLFCDMYYTPSNQIGYVWMGDLALVFMIVFNHLCTRSHPYSWLLAIIVFILSLLVGDGNESINLGIGGAVGIYALCNIRRMSKIQWVAFVGFAVGTLFLCLSPGIIARSSLESSFSFTRYIVHLLMDTRAFLVFVVVFIVCLVQRRFDLAGFYRQNMFYVNGLLVLLVFNMIVGVTTRRQLFGFELFSCILTVRILKDHAFNSIVLALLTLAIILIYKLKYDEVIKFNESFKKCYAAVAEKIEGTVYIDFPDYSRFVNISQPFDYDNLAEHVVGIQALIYNEFRQPYLSALTKDMITGDEYPKITVLPTPFEYIDTINGNKSYSIDGGYYVFCQDRTDAARFILHRKIGALGIYLPFKDYEVKFEEYGKYDTSTHRVAYGSFYTPFVKISDIEIVSDVSH